MPGHARGGSGYALVRCCGKAWVRPHHFALARITTGGVGPCFAAEGAPPARCSRSTSISSVVRAPGGVSCGDGHPPLTQRFSRAAADQLIEARGCQLLCLSPYSSPDLNPINEAFSKVKHRLRSSPAVRARQASVEAVGAPLDAIAAQEDVRRLLCAAATAHTGSTAMSDRDLTMTDASDIGLI